MILSFHPCFKADRNIICAGRKPGIVELDAIKAADAVILPQGCSRSLYEMAKKNCPNIFPNYDVRYKYPGKIGQINLFRKIDILHPKSEVFYSFDEFSDKYKSMPENLPFKFPFVFKFNWGGEGDNVYLITSDTEYKDVLQKAAKYEHSGQSGFLLQEYIPSGNRTLRVAVIGTKILSYWRIQHDTDCFHSSLAKGAVLDFNSGLKLQDTARASAADFCDKTGINLAGFDFLFSSEEKKEPLFLEINYFFGREGLGGSERFYRILIKEISKWLESISS